MVEARVAQLTGVYAVSALGRGADAQLAGALAGVPAFGPVDRFDTAARRVTVAATVPEVATLPDELAAAIDGACRAAGLDRAQRAGCALLLAVHGGPTLGAGPVAGAGPALGPAPAVLAGQLAARCGLSGHTRVYTSACVSASTAVADAAARITRGDVERVVVAAGYLVEPDQFALFDAGRALAVDGAVRPFSAGRRGLLLGDGVAAVVLESSTGRRRGVDPVATVVGWGRAGDAFHPCQPEPGGTGLARAVGGALRRAGLPPQSVGYVNANATGTAQSDTAEAAALRRALGGHADRVPVSSTKSVHGHALEASGLLELVVTALALRHGELPVNAGWLAQDESCPLNVVKDGPRRTTATHALTLNAAFGGANTALLVGVG
ncbi:beta-ketoacyl synthase N-terminal-like domain-containing protein [Micromonospora noduli]|uniref:Beta-ketoacyl-[acyl-carrier-protein] synthase II n=1 Tax=Micromonospora noduli TaxID=709876 RepID=A0ABX9CUA3_9ACTN|nr:beta-ketoacyl synthase N-terminal-like domain-containing protein [Micromonospora noduli]RAO10361.1 Beta-ketoacyl-[acyl-carrier-protein] synthase II [Micromonospora noduli]RAO10794.1 Beta-ketoacyl-[acyl-carrier-protein] synthase II [Micromonospora noduli]RAO23618.1 Beta-ketoacyl-[acyl-carrier-protein] synthase II [Micromonospora noduli]